MSMPYGRDAPVFTPLPAAEVERLLAVVDERLRLRQLLEPAPGTSKPGNALPAIPPAPEADPEMLAIPATLEALAAPMFEPGREGGVTRVVKRLLNVPLRVFATPQHYFNTTVRQLARAWSSLLRAMLDYEALLRIELTAQRAEMTRLAEEQRRLTAALTVLRAEGVRSSCVSFTRVGDSATVSWPARDEEPSTAAPDALPVAPATLTSLRVVGLLEIATPEVVEHRFLPHWLGMLRAGGELCVVVTDWEATFAQVGAGQRTAAELGRLASGPDGRGRTVHPPEAVLSLLARVGVAGARSAAHTVTPDGWPTVEIIARTA